MATSVVDEQGKVRIPEEVRRQMDLRAGDTLVWIPLGSTALVRKKGKTSVEDIRRRIDELRRKAPECFVADEGELPPVSPDVEALREWALAKLGLKE
ncbi:MAG: hypothetical protein DRJ69_06160 [Thermoprotei archaeon]|nr:MAG: hypothetical protein DRJ69_06160 [Thermoprotei archaeon]